MCLLSLVRQIVERLNNHCYFIHQEIFELEMLCRHVCGTIRHKVKGPDVTAA